MIGYEYITNVMLSMYRRALPSFMTNNEDDFTMDLETCFDVKQQLKLRTSRRR